MVSARSLAMSALLALAGLIPGADAHMSLFHPSMYGFDRGDPETVYPLANKGFDQWWFRGNLDNPPREAMTLTPGTTQTVEITCGKWISSWGSNPSWESCPNDQGSYHAGGQGWGGWGGNQESNLMGCALAIAYKPNAWDVRPEDFIVMSVQEQCVRQRDTPFEIPANLPACPKGGCTCAWFWQGQNSAEEMYMTGFKCDVNGGVTGVEIPRPRKPQQTGNSDTATQPFYWANWGSQNVDWHVEWNTRPKYNSKMGWIGGAQTKAFAGLGGKPAPAPAPSSPSSTAPSPSSSAASSTTTTTWAAPSSATTTTTTTSTAAASTTTTTSSVAPSSTSPGYNHDEPVPTPSQTGTHSLDLPNHAADPHYSTTSSTSAAQPTGGKICKKVRRHPRSRARTLGHSGH